MSEASRELDLNSVKTVSIQDRQRKVRVENMAGGVHAGMTVGDLLDALPKVLAADDLRQLVDRLEEVIRRERLWLFMLGGHVIKTGAAPLLTPLIRKRWIRCLSMNGSAAIHDVEIAFFGQTSEVVEENLEDGTFGMASETAALLNETAATAAQAGLGFGQALGQMILERDAPHASLSVLAQAADSGIPATVHVALGTDIVHQHPSADGAAIGEVSLRDFRILAAQIAGMEGGAVLNVGSAVLMPEVFLKALTVARNLGNTVEDFTAADFDMIRHYRPLSNVVRRPTQGRGWGTHITGHHEILLPLLIACLMDRVEGPGNRSAS